MFLGGGFLQLQINKEIWNKMQFVCKIKIVDEKYVQNNTYVMICKMITLNVITSVKQCKEIHFQVIM